MPDRKSTATDKPETVTAVEPHATDDRQVHEPIELDQNADPAPDSHDDLVRRVERLEAHIL